MRVDFLSSFKQVQRLINAKTSETQKPADFTQVLNRVSEEKSAQPVEIIEKINIPEIQKGLNEAPPRARYDFAKGELLAPQPAAIEIHPEPAESVNGMANRVKTPSGLSGRLIKLDDPFAGMSKLQKNEVVGHLVSLAGAEHGIDPALSLGVIKAESNFNPTAVSNDGHESKGLMQLLDTTGKEMMSRLGMEENYTPFDPEQNIDLGVGYLKRLHELFQSPTELGGNLKTFAAANSSSLEKLAVAAYNAGEGRVASAQQRANKAGKDPSQYDNIEPYLPEITREYVKHVISARNNLSQSIKG